MDDCLEIRGFLAKNRIVDAMDVASFVAKTPFSSAPRESRLSINSAVFAVIGIILPLSSHLSAQPQLVEIAREPKIATTPHSVPTQSVRLLHSQERQEVAEPDRMQPAQKGDASPKDVALRINDSIRQGSSFLPPQRPIGQVNIDSRSKPKNGNNAVPENLAEKAMGQTPVVQAATANEMLGEMVSVKSHNRDELFAYHPLYFEEVNLERYGRTCGPIQPALSGLRFFATIPSLPYAMSVHNPYKTYTTRWPYEAGWGAPKVKELRPLEAKPCLVQAGAITGLLFVLP